MKNDPTGKVPSVKLIVFEDTLPLSGSYKKKARTSERTLEVFARFPLFDIGYYVKSHPTHDFHGVNPIEHYFETPIETRSDPHPLFDRSFYRANYPNISGRDEFLDYLQSGDREGRSPHILFDPIYYRASNPDLAHSDQLTLLHFVTSGHQHGRNPHPLFNTSWYTNKYPDSLESPNALIHYVTKGAKECYSPHPLFDPVWYLSQTQAPESQENPLVHYLTVGSLAGLSPHPLFNPGWYLRTQVDSEEMITEPLSYFLTRGAALGHDPNPLFSSNWYLKENPDVVASGMVSILHYVMFGAAEHRDPHPAFSTSAYLQAQSYSMSAQKNPLLDALARDRLGAGGTTAPLAAESSTRGFRIGEPPKSDKKSGSIPHERRALADVISAHSSDECARRVVNYFNIIDRLEMDDGATSLTRAEKLDNLTGHIRHLLTDINEVSAPEVSIVIPCYNHVEYTIACVISILEHASNVRYEIIIGNDNSSDETGAIFDSLGGIVKCVTPAVNGGFITNCNHSAKYARGKYILLLNNDTLVIDRWMDELIAPFERFNDVGLVGSKLLMSDGRLQEAGGIIWSDGSGWNFGRNGDPMAPEFNYIRDVDYCSGASIAIPKTLWEELNGFDLRYLPAYYDDSDLAFEVRNKRLRTLYSPHSALIHHEGVSHGTDTSAGIKAYQIENQKKFAKKWKKVLETESFETGETVFLARNRSRSHPHMLVVDHYVPQYDRDAGSRLMYEHCKMFVDAGFQITFWPDNLFFDQTYVKVLQNLGIEVLYGDRYVNKFPEWIADAGRYIDYVFLSRAHISDKYVDEIKASSDAKILFCGHDLHFRRLEAEYKVTKNEDLLKEIAYWTKAERRMWEASDVIYYPGIEERDYVAQQVPNKVSRLMCVYIYSDEELRAMQKHLENLTSREEWTMTFVAGFRHRPNVDGAKWLVREILPRVKAKIPQVSCLLIGSNPPAEVVALAGDNVVVTGYVADAVLHRIYRTTTVVVAPLRFGGGIQGKILEGLRFGVPVVTTPSGAEGMPNSSKYLEVGNDADEFSAKITGLMADRERRFELANEGIKFLQQYYSYSVAVQDIGRDVPEVLTALYEKSVLKRKHVKDA